MYSGAYIIIGRKTDSFLPGTYSVDVVVVGRAGLGLHIHSLIENLRLHIHVWHKRLALLQFWWLAEYYRSTLPLLMYPVR